MLKTLRLSPTADLGSLVREGELVGFNVSADGLVYLVFARKLVDYRLTQASGASFPKTVPKKPQDYRVVSLVDGEILHEIEIRNERFNIHDVQPLPGKELLMVCGRSAYRGEEDFDRNGRIYSEDGTFVREILLGDGIQNVQATASGVIWTSYFDEGIFGNFGWQDPVGAAGLVAWDFNGNRLFEFQPEQGFEPMADCYALNVESDVDVWCYYYTDFPLVRIRRNTIDLFWNVPVSGSGAFAISGTRALFRGGYNRCDTFHLLELNTDHSAKELFQFQVQDENGHSLKNSRVVGRGRSIYMLNDAKVYRLEIEMASQVFEA